MQQQKFDIPAVNYRDIVSSSVKYNNDQVVTLHQLKQISDGSNRIPSFSSRDLREMLDLLNQIDEKQLLIDAQLIEHKVYSIFIFMLKDLLNKWYVNNSFTEFESSYLFPLLTKLICKMNYHSTDLVELLKQYLENVNDTKYFSVPPASTITSKLIEDNHQVSNTFSSSIFASNESQNKEEITLIMCDQNSDGHDMTKGIPELLQQLYGSVCTYSNLDTYLDYINQIQTEKIFLILSGQTADDMIDKVCNLKQVDSIYIYCINSTQYEHYLKENNKKYHKVIGIYTEHESLLRAIEKNIRYVIKQLQAATTNGFLSTSGLKDPAKIFAGVRARIERGLESVMLEIHVDTTKLTTALADIAHYSEFPEEKEVLFDLGASFIIDSVFYNELDTTWWVKLSAASEELSMDNIQTLLKKCGETDMNLLFGELLLKMEFYDTCRNYSESLFDLYGNGHENVVKIEEIIAWAFEEEKKWDQAIQHYTKAFDLYSSSNRWEDASRMLIWTANCYNQKQDKIIMRQYIEKADEILKNKTNLPDHHCQFGDIISLYGILEDINQAARNHFMKALDIYQNALTVCKCGDHDRKIAQTYENIGIRYIHEKDYVQAKIYFQESEKITSKNIIFSKDRRACTTCLQTIGGLYNLAQDRMNATTYLTKTFEFIDTDLIESVYKDNLEVQESVLQIKLFKNIYGTTLLYELKRLELLKKLQPSNYEKIIERHLNIGEIYRKTEDYKWAREHYDNAYEICETKISSKDRQAQSLFDMGHRLLLVDIDYAFICVSKALEIQLLALKSDDVNIAFSHYDMYMIYEHIEQFDIAIEHLQKAIDILEKHLNDEQNYQFNVKEQYAMCYYFSASMYRKKQEFSKSTEYLLTTVNIIERFFSDIPDNYCILAKCYRMMALNYFSLRDYNANIIFQKKYLETIEQHSEVDPLLQSAHDHASEISDVLLSLGVMYFEKMNYDQSSFYYEKFIKSAPVDQNVLTSCFATTGNCYMNKKCYEKAAVRCESQLPMQLK
ncbi:hypothetical protein I4U23_017015 [Adineta vaga]|nr:hypothetical protein I4U23_017015 [Adineta vaga]